MKPTVADCMEDTDEGCDYNIHWHCFMAVWFFCANTQLCKYRPGQVNKSVWLGFTQIGSCDGNKGAIF